MSTPLTDEEKIFLLHLARGAVECAVRKLPPPSVNLEVLTPSLREHGAAFITLTIENELRGCIGALEAYQPLVHDVLEHSADAALKDPRFMPVTERELRDIQIEISRLTAPVPLLYSAPADLAVKLRPYVDGVILKSSRRRATFLPQVWAQLPNPEDFLDHLCAKMGVRSSFWRDEKLEVSIYQVEEFHEDRS